jgi:hypothetical protein
VTGEKVPKSTLAAEGSAAAVARLRRVAARLGELGADGEWLGGVLQVYLDPFAGCTFDQAAGLVPDAGAEHWRTAARRDIRDDAIRALAGFFPGLPRTRCEIAQLLARYAASRWRVDRARPTIPEGYLGTQRAPLYAALVAGGGRVPGVSRIRQLLSTCSPVFIGSEFDETCGHGSDRTRHRDPQRR